MHLEKMQTVFLISAKKCEKCIFFGLFAKSGIFSSAKNRCFNFPPRIVGSCSLGAPAMPLFLENNIKRENKMFLLAQRSFFFLFFWTKPKFKQKIVPTDRERLKSSGIFTLSSECSHYFQHLCSR